MSEVPSLQPLGHDIQAGPIRVFIADDHRITVWGLQQLVNSAPSMTVVGTASTLAEVLDSEGLPIIDVMVLDLDLGGENSAASISEVVRRRNCRVLVLTASSDLAIHRQVMMYGARGVLHKAESAAIILKAIEKVHGGEVWLHRALLGEVLTLLTDTNFEGRARSPPDPHLSRIAALTPRERTIIAAMVRLAGAKQMAVASQLGMSEHTLRNHLTSIYSKLEVRGRLELHLYAVERGLIHGA